MSAVALWEGSCYKEIRNARVLWQDLCHIRPALIIPLRYTMAFRANCAYEDEGFDDAHVVHQNENKKEGEREP